MHSSSLAQIWWSGSTVGTFDRWISAADEIHLLQREKKRWTQGSSCAITISEVGGKIVSLKATVCELCTKKYGGGNHSSRITSIYFRLQARYIIMPAAEAPPRCGKQNLCPGKHRYDYIFVRLWGIISCEKREEKRDYKNANKLLSWRRNMRQRITRWWIRRQELQDEVLLEEKNYYYKKNYYKKNNY